MRNEKCHEWLSRLGVILNHRRTFILGANVKNRPGIDPDKRCAESEMLQTARSIGLTLDRIVVFGTRQNEPDARSKRWTRTLHCCPSCRDELKTALWSSRPTVTLDTEILLASPAGTYEWFTVRSLLHFHGDFNKSMGGFGYKGAA